MNLINYETLTFLECFLGHTRATAVLAMFSYILPPANPWGGINVPRDYNLTRRLEAARLTVPVCHLHAFLILATQDRATHDPFYRL